MLLLAGNGDQICDLPITSSVALPLSYGRHDGESPWRNVQMTITVSSYTVKTKLLLTGTQFLKTIFSVAVLESVGWKWMTIPQ